MLEVNPRLSGTSNFVYELGGDPLRASLDPAFDRVRGDHQSGYKEGILSRSVVPAESRHWKGALSGKMLSSPSWEVLHVAGHCDRPDITSRACPLPHRLAASETRDLTPGGVSGAARSRREAARGHLGPRSVVPPR